MELWAVVVAAGSGSRFGRPKQLEKLGDRRVIDWSIRAMARVTTGVVVVGPNALGSADELGVAFRVDGGQTRSDSVRNGLEALPSTAVGVLIHDAARPLVPTSVVDAVVSALEQGAEAVVPVVPVTDSLRSLDGHAVDRESLVAVQTPQGFRLDTLLAAHQSQAVASDDATLMELVGRPVSHVPGHPVNMKITFPHDLVVAEELLKSL